jgi:hypothetical protein
MNFIYYFHCEIFKAELFQRKFTKLIQHQIKEHTFEDSTVE